MDRMHRDPKLLRLKKQFYKHLTFKVEMGSQSSSWKTQYTGIRQGCTLSPYLFLILMAAAARDVREDQNLDEEFFEHTPPNHDFDDVLYADDTIIFSTCTDPLQKYLHKIEDIACKYGLHLYTKNVKRSTQTHRRRARSTTKAGNMLR